MLHGLVGVRSMELQSYFQDNFFEAVDSHVANEIVIAGVTSWNEVRFNFIALLVLIVPSFFWIFYKDNQNSVESVSLFLYASIKINDYLKNFFFNLALIEKVAISFERCLYLEDLESERGYWSYKRERSEFGNGQPNSLVKLEDYIFEERKRRKDDLVGQIVQELNFQNVSAEYVPGQLVLKNLHFRVRRREKVGIVGRTGSGKTTILKLLWRSLDTCEGSVKLNCDNIDYWDLKDYRNFVSIINQEPFLTEGTLKDNLTLVTCNNEEQSLATQILNHIEFSNSNYIKDGLDMKIENGGENLSSGEKQVVSFLRVIIEDKPIILLDEATASVDLETETKIQKLMENRFKDKMMLIVAHRIDTVMKCDKILVLKDGKVEAFDKYENLMETSEEFKKIVSGYKEENIEND